MLSNCYLYLKYKSYYTLFNFELYKNNFKLSLIYNKLNILLTIFNIIDLKLSIFYQILFLFIIFFYDNLLFL